MLAKKNEYLKEAYRHLEIISQDEQKRIEYTARQKAIYDYNTLMEENYNRGEAVGIEKGMLIALSKLIDSDMNECEAKQILGIM